MNKKLIFGIILLLVFLAVAVDSNVKTTVQTAPKDVPTKTNLDRVGLNLAAKSAIVVDVKSGAVLFSKDEQTPRPIASITKLLTALVVLDKKPDFKSIITIQKSDLREGDVGIAIKEGDSYVYEALLRSSLVASSNTATVAVARVVSADGSDFVTAMNAKAVEIGMMSANFVEPTGLDPLNSASAADVAQLLKSALKNEIISEMILTSSFELKPISGLGKNQLIKSTDELFGSFITQPPYAFFGGKTGFLYESGYCFAAAAQKEGSGEIIAVVLDAPTKADRFIDVKNILYWTFDAYKWAK